MSNAPPIPFVWSGQAFEPAGAYLRRAQSVYGAGEVVTLAPVEERSSASHRHFFACVREAWLNLPEQHADRFPNPDALRKYALIRAGYRDERTIVCATKAEAERVAAFVKPMDEYAVVRTREATVTVWTAQSQSTKAMGKERFQESKDKVLEILAEIVGVEVESLTERAAAA